MRLNHDHSLLNTVYLYTKYGLDYQVLFPSMGRIFLTNISRIALHSCQPPIWYTVRALSSGVEQVECE